MGDKRFHVVGLPHTQTTAEWSNCAFTANVRGFIKMMKSLGHEVILYGSEEHDVEVDEFVSCISRQEQRDIINVHGPDTILNSSFDDGEQWPLMNGRVVTAIRERQQPDDIVCTIGGGANHGIADGLPDMPIVEFAVGMSSIMFAPNVYRVFGSNTWRHILYGRYWGAHGMQAFPYDRVIPHYIDPAEFTFRDREDRGDYFLFVGRLNEDKGIGIAIDVARATGRRLVVAGQGMSMPEDVDYRGRIGPDERRELMAGAAATFVPSLYIEPFGMVAIEALVSGSPIITTDFGGPSEINVHGVTGFKCHTMREFFEAGLNVDQINPRQCRMRAQRYYVQEIRHEYDHYFDGLLTYRRSGSWLALDEAVTS